MLEQTVELNRTCTSIVFRRLILQQMGSYNQIYMRPYEAHIDGQAADAIINRVAEFGTGKVTGSLISGTVPNLVSPIATPQGHVLIPNGWEQPRLRFVLEVECTFNIGTTIAYYVQGYTDYNGITASRHIDPQMHFFINSITAVTRYLSHTPTGPQIIDRLYEGNQYLSDMSWGQHALGVNALYTMRPQDLYTGMQANYLSPSFDYHGVESFCDTRNMLRNEPVSSNRNNNIGTAYVASVIDSYNMAVNGQDYGQSEQDLYAAARLNLIEAIPNDNPFIREISRSSGVFISNQFNYQQLQRIDPNIGAVIIYAEVGPTHSAQLHHTGQTAYWNGSNRETVAATILSHAVPAIMMELLITKISLRSTNYDVSGAVTTTLAQFKSLTTADMSRYLETFKRRFEMEVLYDITYGNQELYVLEMTVDLFGETRIELSLGNGPMTPFVTPSFCDHLFPPVITNDATLFAGVSADFEGLVRNCVTKIADKTQAIPSNFLV